MQMAIGCGREIAGMAKNHIKTNIIGWQCALPLPVAPRLRAPSFLVATLPLALVLLELRRRLRLGLWALFRPLCDC